MEDEVCRVYDLPLIWQLVKVHQMSIYILRDDSGKILQEGYKPTGGKKRIKRAFLPKKKIRTFEKDDLYLCRESSWKKSREHCSLMRQKCVVFAEV